MSIVFICGSHRSGSTSLLRAIELSSDAFCLVEPMSNLNIESRHLIEGFLYDPYHPILENVAPRVARGLARRSHYVEKQNSLVPFIPYLWRYFGCKFVVPMRDGREVVTSLVNWHTKMYPIIYQECREACDYSEHARKVLEAQCDPDEFDYSLPRPGADDPWHAEWAHFTRLEMTAWYWNFINQYVRKMARAVPAESVRFVEYTRPNVETIRRIYEFIGLGDFDPDAVAALLKRKVNSLADRQAPAGRFPHWRDWTPSMTQRFYELAWESFRDLGYAQTSERPAPPQVNVTAAAPRLDDGALDAIVALTGTPSVCHVESLAAGTEARAALAACTAAFATTHDIEALIDRVARAAIEVVYLRAPGYEPRLARHRHDCTGTTRASSVRVSPRAAEDQLRGHGFQTVAVFPVRDAAGTGRDTVLVASRRRQRRTRLVPAKHLDLSFRPYRVVDLAKDAHHVLDEVNRCCAYLSDPALRLINDLAFFQAIVVDLMGLPGRKLGTVRDLALDRTRVNLALRVDVDIDFAAAMGMARIAAERAAPATFFLLHTAAYHGILEGDTFLRNRGAAQLYRELAATGVEIGLHVDPYQLYHEHGIDGGAAVRTELEWLRELGIAVSGITGHNCASVYGAESVEMFDRWQVRPGHWFSRDYRYAPLGVLHADALAVEYEGGSLMPALEADPDELEFVNVRPGGDFLRDPRWLRRYLLDNGYCCWGYDFNVWILGSDDWVIAGREGQRQRFEFGVNWSRVRDFLAELDHTRRVAITLHPCYFGKRSAPGEPPVAG